MVQLIMMLRAGVPLLDDMNCTVQCPDWHQEGVGEKDGIGSDQGGRTRAGCDWMRQTCECRRAHDA
jgi:hypothetical protein